MVFFFFFVSQEMFGINFNYGDPFLNYVYIETNSSFKFKLS